MEELACSVILRKINTAIRKHIRAVYIYIYIYLVILYRNDIYSLIKRFLNVS